MLVSVADFAEERNQDKDTVNAYIRNHPEIQRETIKKGRTRYLDTDTKAFEALEQKYPRLKPVEVIEDTEARRQLIEAQQFIIKLQQQLAEAAPKIAMAERNQHLLDMVSAENEQLKAKNAKQMESLEQRYRELLTLREQEKFWLEAKEQYNKELDAAEWGLVERKKRIEELEQQLVEEKSKTWWDKIRGR
ncbi:hypothetical protein AALA22_15565 [Anaerovoracaceae bacterium 41-7]|jgi:hypothetical protein